MNRKLNKARSGDIVRPRLIDLLRASGYKLPDQADAKVEAPQCLYDRAEITILWRDLTNSGSGEWQAVILPLDDVRAFRSLGDWIRSKKERRYK